MAKLIIEGGTPLNGELVVGGAKNEVLKLIPLGIILDGSLRVNNAPRINDVFTQLEIFKSLGGRVSFEGQTIDLDASSINSFEVDKALLERLRASIVFAGALLARFGQTTISCPGGCVIGARSIDTHLDAFRQAGVNIKTENDTHILIASSPAQKRLEIHLKEKSVTATENLILYLAKGKLEATVSNIAIEPEVMDLIDVINRAGGKIEMSGENQIEIEGRENLSLDSVEALPDRIEAGSLAIAITATGGEGSVYPYPAKHLETFTKVLQDCNINISVQDDRATISKSSDIKPFQIETAPYPGFPTDLQSPMSLIAAIATGKSTIDEKMFDNRLGYINELKAMGLNAEIIGTNRVEIDGPTQFTARDIESLDLRSGITVLIAAMMADGESVLNKAEIVDRGYENIEVKLNKAGARIKRVL